MVLALMWRSRVRYAVKAAALATGTLLTTPYLFMYDMMVLAIPVAFLVRIGLAGGFRAYELPALACALAMIAGFYPLTGVPLGFGATLIVAALVLRRAGLWRRPEPAPRWCRPPPERITRDRRRRSATSESELSLVISPE